MAEDVQPRLGLRPVLGQRGEDDTGGAEDDRERAGPVDADAERSRCLVARAADLRALVRRRQPLGIRSSASSTSSLQRRFATSKSSVPDASATSIARSPVSRSRT